MVLKRDSDLDLARRIRSDLVWSEVNAHPIFRDGPLQAGICVRSIKQRVHRIFIAIEQLSVRRASRKFFLYIAPESVHIFHHIRKLQLFSGLCIKIVIIVVGGRMRTAHIIILQPGHAGNRPVKTDRLEFIIAGIRELCVCKLFPHVYRFHFILLVFLFVRSRHLIIFCRECTL